MQMQLQRPGLRLALFLAVPALACGGSTSSKPPSESPADAEAPSIGDAGNADGGARPGDAGGAADAARDASDAASLPLQLEASTRPTQAFASKVDILFAIDNSASMGDKQQYLEAAVPDLINQLINPNCVDPASGAVLGVSSNGQCAQGGLAFTPVSDMHVGIVSTALGSRGGNLCSPTAMGQPPFQNLPAHNDDQAHLLNRTLTYATNLSSAIEGFVADATPAPAYEFLDWFPGGSGTDAGAGTGPDAAAADAGAGTSGATGTSGADAGPDASTDASTAEAGTDADTDAAGTGAGPGAPITSSAVLVGDVSALVGGVGVFGCGIESQLESWYRFLIQPDPYASIVTTTGPEKATWSGVDATILQQRHDFLRPDSLVTIIVLSDENDSEIDVRALGQQAFLWMSTEFDPPRGTAACGVDGVGGNPADSSCMSCAQATQSVQMTDSNCTMGAYESINDWGFDPNLRHVHTKAKYGVDPQFPITRYTNGLTSTTVPDRDGEYPGTSTGTITSQTYVGTNDCVNPLFAASLPDGSDVSPATLCNLPAGQRSQDMVFYLHIGGVPASLLHFTPGDVNASTLTDADWVKILGNDPEDYDTTGIDSHMIESFEARPGIPTTPPASVSTPFSPAPDSIVGYDWVTNAGTGHILNVDREYACIFPIVDSQGNPAPRDCTQAQNEVFCDCPSKATLTADQTPPICDPSTQTMQVGAKAYPTIRELEVAHLMGPQGLVASICPQHVKESSPGDPLFGFRPGITTLVNHLAPVIGKPLQ